LLDIRDEVKHYNDYMSRLNSADVPLPTILKDIVRSTRFEYAYNSELLELMSILVNNSHTPSVEDYESIVRAIRGLGMDIYSKIKQHGLYDREGAHHLKFGGLYAEKLLVLDHLSPTEPLY
jgi:hypothetical protein